MAGGSPFEVKKASRENVFIEELSFEMDFFSFPQQGFSVFSCLFQSCLFIGGFFGWDSLLNQLRIFFEFSATGIFRFFLSTSVLPSFSVESSVDSLFGALFSSETPGSGAFWGSIERLSPAFYE